MKAVCYKREELSRLKWNQKVFHVIREIDFDDRSMQNINKKHFSTLAQKLTNSLNKKCFRSYTET